jgi:hypothetical protein
VTLPRPLVVTAVLLCLVQTAAAQSAPNVARRPFDGVSGILIACRPAPGYRWTEEACAHAIAEARQRAALSKMPIAVVDSAPDLSNRRFGQIGGFDGDRAVRVHLTFKPPQGGVKRLVFSFASAVVVEPKGSNVAPGQRLPVNFVSQGIDFEPDITSAAADPAIGQVLDLFFQYGEGRQ